MPNISLKINIDNMPNAELYEFNGQKRVVKSSKVDQIEKCIEKGNLEDAKWLFGLSMCDVCKTVCPSSLLQFENGKDLCHGCKSELEKDKNNVSKQSNMQNMQHRNENKDG